MGQDIQVLGELLRTRRQELNVSLKEAENATSIRVNYLKAIEEGAMDKLISPVYAQGFVRQYVVFLGLDAESILAEHKDAFKQPVVQRFDYGIGTLETRVKPGAGVKWVPGSLWFGAFGVLLVVGYYFARMLDVI